MKDFQLIKHGFSFKNYFLSLEVDAIIFNRFNFYTGVAFKYFKLQCVRSNHLYDCDPPVSMEPMYVLLYLFLMI